MTSKSKPTNGTYQRPTFLYTNRLTEALHMAMYVGAGDYDHMLIPRITSLHTV